MNKRTSIRAMIEADARRRQVVSYHVFLLSRPTPGRIAMAHRLMQREVWLTSAQALVRANELNREMREELRRVRGDA